jgi:magnesium chelatase family protein
MENSFKRMNLSARAYDRILRVARTIADIDYITSGGEVTEGIDAGGKITKKHVMEAVQMRSLDKYWKNN